MREPTPQYRVIFNWDGQPFGEGEYPQSVDRLMHGIYDSIEGTQVDAMFWSIGSHEAEWPSEVHERLGDSENRTYDSLRGMRHSESVRAMFERGENPYQAMVDRGHELGMQVYVSMRMNDNHFYVDKAEDIARLGKGTQLRRDHPEWLLDVDDVAEWRPIGSWNMAIPEVREHRLSYIREACLQADWDGVELDWQRHPFHVPQNYGYRLRYVLTDLQRAIRQVADEIAEERGRPFYVASRVATTLESCRNIGYDVEKWVNDDLTDIIIGAGGSGTDLGFEVAEFKKLTEDTGIRLYGGFDSLGRHEANRLVSHSEWRDAWLRAVAQGYYDQGADGLYTFNWFPKKQEWRGLLSTIGSPDTLKGRDKIYTALHRGPTYLDGAGGGAINDRIYGETSTVLFRTLTGDGPKFTIGIHEDVAASEAIELHIEMQHFLPEDSVDVLLDGEKLADPIIRDVAEDDPNDPADVSENKWLVWTLDAEQAAKGDHQVKVILVNRDSRIRPPLIVNHLEIHVRYEGTS